MAQLTWQVLAKEGFDFRLCPVCKTEMTLAIAHSTTLNRDIPKATCPSGCYSIFLASKQTFETTKNE